MGRSDLRAGSHRGFTLIELMIVVAVIAILAALAYPAYTQYLLRDRAVEGPAALAALAVKLEQRLQDVGGYGRGDDGRDDGDCGILRASVRDFTVDCTAAAAGQTFVLRAVGTGPVDGVEYTLDDVGVRRTVRHPRGVPAGNCWSIRGGTCDS